MSARAARLLAWSSAGIYFCLAAVGSILQVMALNSSEGVMLATSLGLSVSIGLSTITAALIAARHPKNPIGWILLGLSMSWGVEAIQEGYLSYGLIGSPGNLPGFKLAVLYESAGISRFALVLLSLLFLWFPDGRPVSERWAWPAWLSTTAAAVYVAVSVVLPAPVSGYPAPGNPYGLNMPVGSLFDRAREIAGVVLLLSLAASTVSLVVRLRWSTGDERQQVKWFLYAAAFFPAAVILLEFGGSRLQPVGLVLQLISITGMVTAVAVSIFKYRLYDIDLIINRTLVYGLLTGILALVYFSGVTLLQFLFQELAGQESQFAVVMSTLAIAALFNPLRRRIQEWIDRRFYRRRYNAEKTLESVAEISREAVDPDHLGEKIMAVVGDTIRPEQISLWLIEDFDSN